MKREELPLADNLFLDFFEQINPNDYLEDFENKDTLEKAKENDTIDEIVEEVENMLKEAVDSYIYFLENERKF